MDPTVSSFWSFSVMLTEMTLHAGACLCYNNKKEGTDVSMVTTKVQYIIPHYCSQAGTFGQKLIYQRMERGKQCIVGRLSSILYVNLISEPG